MSIFIFIFRNGLNAFKLWAQDGLIFPYLIEIAFVRKDLVDNKFLIQIQFGLVQELQES
jgi:hypothetical protein